LKGRSRFLLGADLRFIHILPIALGCIILGLIIASSLDLPRKTIATLPSDSGQSYPVAVDKNGEYVSPFVSVVEKVQDAVVNIVALQRTQKTYYDDFFWRFFQVPQEPLTSSGSGFFFRPDGYILTNNHVVENAEKVVARTSSGYRYDAVVVGTDPQTDLAVLKVEPEAEITYIPFGNSGDIKVGDWAIAIGNPFPEQGLDRTVTVGVISAKGRSNLRFGRGTPRYQDYIQTDASINPGNSGGPLLNLKGEAIGVNAAISSPSGGSVGIGFAIPIDLARAIVPDLIVSGRVARGWLGISLRDVTEAEARERGLGAVRGVYVETVLEGSPAEQAGIKPGDIITSFNGENVTNTDHLSVLISTAPRGKDAQIELSRSNKILTIKAEIVDQLEYQKTHSDQFDQPGRVVQWLGMDLMTYTQDIARQIGADFYSGIFINRVAYGSQASQAGIMPGSVITQVDKKDVKNLVELELLVADMENRDKTIPLLLVDPRGAIEYKAIRP
jgi:serine protease Do